MSLSAWAETPSTPSIDELLERYLDPRLVGVGYSVDELVFEGDRLRVVMMGGTLVPIVDSVDEPLGYVYVGGGTLTYEPPNDVERYQLQLKTGHDRLEGPLEDAFFLAADPETLARLAPPEDAATVDVPARARTILANRWEVYSDERWGLGLNLEVLRLEHRLNDPEGESFVFAEFGFDGLKPYLEEHTPLPFRWLSYLDDPAGALEDGRRVALFGHQRTLVGHHVEGFCSHSPTLRDSRVDLVAWDMDLIIPPGGPTGLSEIHNTVSVTLTASEQPVNAVVLDLVSRTWNPIKQRLVDFEVVRVLDFTGADRPFVHHRGKLLVPLASPLGPGEAEVLTIAYSGEALIALSRDAYTPLNTWPWYPMNGFSDRGTFAATVHFPSTLRMAGTGSTVAVHDDGQTRTERWEEPVAVHFPSMIIGNYTRVEEATTPSGVTVRAFFTPSESQHATDAANEASRVIQFYEDLYGPFPFRELDVANMVENMGFWQGPPGIILVNKARRVVQWVDNPERDMPHFGSAILAHEIAHQYWGHVVGWSGDADQWISESLAEYSSHLFTSHYFGEEDYTARLRGWRMDARLDEGSGGLALAGYRLGGRGRYYLWYNKGPYVMHMLRAWLGDEVFVDALGAIAGAADHRDISTDDLRAALEKRLDADLSWFFDAWVHGHVLPEVGASYEVRDDGIVLRLEQVQEGPATHLRVPVCFELGSRREVQPVWRTVVMDGRELEVVIDDLPAGDVHKVRIDPDQQTLWARDPRAATASP